MSYAVETRELTRIFAGKKKRRRRAPEEVDESVGPVTALDQVSLKIEEGELFGMLGPNGAGKTTLIKILATLLLPTSGQALVAGHDVTKDPFPIRQVINMVSGGETSGYGLLTARENIWMFSQFYGVPSKVSKGRIDELMHIFGLWDKRNAKVRMLSTGQRQKMNMIRGFVTDPDILFLDEPTLGLDVNAARVIREYVTNWVRGQKGKTVLLTTHYMAEADQMCDRIASIDKGKILACDTPEILQRMMGPSRAGPIRGSSARTASHPGFSSRRSFHCSGSRRTCSFISSSEARRSRRSRRRPRPRPGGCAGMIPARMRRHRPPPRPPLARTRTRSWLRWSSAARWSRSGSTSSGRWRASSTGRRKSGTSNST